MASSPSEIRVGQGLELALSGKRNMALSIAGKEIRDFRHASNLSGGGKTALIVVGVAAVIGVAALVAVDSVRCEDEGDPCD